MARAEERTEEKMEEKVKRERKGTRREPLKNGVHIQLRRVDADGKVHVEKARVEKFLGEGSTCLVYEVKVQMDERHSHSMVMKEFYPNLGKDLDEKEIEIIRDGEGLKISARTKETEEYQRLLEQFRCGYELQNKLSNSQAMEIMVKPSFLATCGDTIYLLSDIHMGKALEISKFQTIEEKLQVLMRVAEVIQLLNEQSYIFIDFKPENMLWIERPKAVRLFDMDSMIDCGNLKELRRENIRYNERYLSPQVRKLMECDQWNFEQKKFSYLGAASDIYCLGLLLFEMIVGRIPTKKELSFEHEIREKFAQRCKKAGCISEPVIDTLWKICKKALEQRRIYRYLSAEEFQNDINEVIRQLGAQPYIPKRRIQTANDTIACYNILEKYPVYHYARYEQGKRILDISITGQHKMRRQMIRAIVSCVQMLDSQIILRLFAQDSGQLLAEMMRENPAFRKTITVFEYEKKTIDEIDKKMVDQPLAEIHLYPDIEPNKIPDVIEKQHSNYILCLEEDTQTAEKWVKMLIDREESQQNRLFADREESQKKRIVLGREECRKKRIAVEKDDNQKKKMIAILGADREQMERLEVERRKFVSENKIGIDLTAIALKKKSADYDERFIKNEIGKRAFAIHTFYYRGQHERASREEIMRDYKKDDYSMYSSMRSALSITYKFGSIGLDIHSQKAPEEFWNKVMIDEQKARKLLDRLTVLEHRSWSAYLILDGWDAPKDEAEIRRYAFEGKNDFKKKDPFHRLHPCLQTAVSGLKLQNFSKKEWDDPSDEQLKKLDELDRTSIRLHAIAGEKLEKAKEKIRYDLDELEAKLEESALSETLEAFRWVRIAERKVNAGDPNREEIWKRAISSLREISTRQKIWTPYMEKIVSDIAMERRVICEYYAYHDYKHSDQDIVEAIPKILTMYRQGKKVNVTLLKPISKIHLENIIGALYLEPERLILLAYGQYQMDQEHVIEFYQRFLQSRGIETEVEMKSVESIRQYRGRIFLDTTGIDEKDDRNTGMMAALQRVKNFKNIFRFYIKDGKICSMYDPSVMVYNRKLSLSVEEILSLLGIEQTLRRKKEYGIDWMDLSSRYYDIWKVYRQMSREDWRFLIDLLEEAEKKNCYAFEIRKGSESRNVTDSIPYPAIKATGLDRFLKECKQEGLLETYILPGKEDDLPILFTTKIEELAVLIKQITQKAAAQPFHHKYELVKRVVNQTEKKYFLEDHTLYVQVQIPYSTMQEADSDLKTEQKTTQTEQTKLAQQLFCLLAENRIVQNLKMTETQLGLQFSFKYATRAVKEILKDEKRILEVMIYFSCLNLGIFDDIQMKCEFDLNRREEQKDNEQLEKVISKNKIDIIGTKNMKIYLIGIGMEPLKEKDFEQIWEYDKKSGMEGSIILINFYYKTASEFPIRMPDRKESRYQMRRQMNIQYLGREDLFDEQTKSKRTMIGERIAEIVKQTL